MTKYKNILVVEDEAMLLEVITFHLVEAGFNVVEADNGVEALKRFQENEIDLVLTDIRMPKMNGRELMATILKQRMVTFAIFTGYSDVPPCILRHEGAKFVFQKPLNLDVIVNAIKQSPFFVPPTLNSLPLLQTKITKNPEPESNESELGRDGFYYFSSEKNFNVGEYVNVEIKVEASNQVIEGIGYIFYANNEQFEINIDKQGYMIEWRSLNLGYDEYIHLIDESNLQRSIPFLGSTMNRGIKNAV